MNLKLIRLRARTMQIQQPGLAYPFALPVLLTILLTFSYGQDLVDLLPDTTFAASIYMIQRQSFLRRLLCHLHFSGRCNF